MKRQKRNKFHRGRIFPAAVFSIVVLGSLCLAPGIRSAVYYGRSAVPEILLQSNAVEEDEEDSYEEISSIELPAAFDLRGVKTVSVSDQGDLATCWAFAALKAVETSMPQELAVFLSADHMVNHNSFGLSPASGGDYSMAMAYLLAWQGPVSEEDDPYGDGISPDFLQAVCHVQTVKMLKEKDYDAIKKAVFTCGGVQTSLYLSEEDRAGNGQVCYRGEEEANHDAVIIGWDDTYPKENFSAEPEADGAFLCVNSWGESYGENGFFYVSYEDSRIGESAISYCGIESRDSYDEIYQTDLCGWTGQMGFGKTDAWFANVYQAKTDGMLTAVGFYATGPDTSYAVYATSGESFRNSVENGKNISEICGKVLASGTFQDTGFYTVKLKKEKKIKAGEDFALVVKIDTPDTDQPVAVEYAGVGRTGNIDTSDGEGYISYDGGSWERTEVSKNCNVCLKAYTRRNDHRK